MRSGARFHNVLPMAESLDLMDPFRYVSAPSVIPFYTRQLARYSL
jgi:hypothetical protein